MLGKKQQFFAFFLTWKAWLPWPSVPPWHPEFTWRAKLILDLSLNSSLMSCAGHVMTQCQWTQPIRSPSYRPLCASSLFVGSCNERAMCPATLRSQKCWKMVCLGGFIPVAVSQQRLFVTRHLGGSQASCLLTAPRPDSLTCTSLRCHAAFPILFCTPEPTAVESICNYRP